MFVTDAEKCPRVRQEVIGVSELSFTALEERYCDVQRIDPAKIEQLLKYGSIGSCRDVVVDFLEDAGYFRSTSLLIQLYVAMDVYIIARSFTKSIGVSNKEFVELYGNIDDIGNKLTTPEDTVDFFTEMLEQCIRWRCACSRDKSNESIKRAAAYINANFMREELSLGSAAASVGLSATYFSALFKKEMGMNFSDYLSAVRIEKAKDMLCCTSKRISEIAYDVGYSDYRYFSQVFKKHTGLSPRKFQHSSNEDTDR